MQCIFPGVSTAILQERSGWEKRMYVLRLPDDSLLVHSAIDLGHDGVEQLKAMGDVRWLFAPNHFHHLGLRPYLSAFPKAKAIASPVAARRLRGKGYPVESLGSLDLPLPSGARFLMCEGTKTGETFLSWPTPDGLAWLVCDAFFHVETLTGPTGWLLRTLNTGPGLAVGQTFLWLGLREPHAYQAWLEETLRHDTPRHVLFSHGRPLTLAAPNALADLVRARLNR
jgi:hypothetical protein